MSHTVCLQRTVGDLSLKGFVVPAKSTEDQDFRLHRELVR